MTDACLRSTGYALMIENNPDQKIQWNRKNYAPEAFESKNFCPAQRKKAVYTKEILAIYIAFFEFARFLWETTKPKFSRQVANQSHISSKWKQFYNRGGTYLTMCCRILQGSTYCQLSQYSRWVSFQTRNQRYGWDPSHNPGRLTENTNRCRWQRLPQMLLMKNSSSSPNKTIKMSQKNRPLEKRNNPGSSERMCCKRRIIK